MVQGKIHKKRRVQSHIHPARCLPQLGVGRRTFSSSQKLCFIINEVMVSPRAAALIDTGPSSFDVRGVVVAERVFISAPPHSTLVLSTPPSFGAMEASGRTRQAREGSSRDKAWAERRAEDVTKSSTPSLSQSRGNPLKNGTRRLSVLIVLFLIMYAIQEWTLANTAALRVIQGQTNHTLMEFKAHCRERKREVDLSVYNQDQIRRGQTCTTRLR